MKIDVNADAFRIVSGFISSEETRYYLRGVYVHPHACGGAVLVATDGHRLFAYYDRTGTADSGYILAPSKAFMKATKRSKEDKPSRRNREGLNSLRLQWDGKKAQIGTEAGELRATEALEAIDGTFPDYKRVIPRNASGGVGAFNASYIGDFEAAARDMIDSGLSDCRTPSLSFASADNSSPAFVTVNGCANVCALLMPIRDEIQTEPPEFLNATPYAKPRYEITAPARAHVYGCGHGWMISVKSRVSKISDEKKRELFFNTHPEAERAFNRIVTGLARSGIENLPTPIGPVYHFTAEELKRRETRVAGIVAARTTFEAATEEDLSQPWELARVKPELHDEHHNNRPRTAAIRKGLSWTSLRDSAVSALPHLSQGRAMAALYRVAA